jgi:hypothetical protein
MACVSLFSGLVGLAASLWVLYLWLRELNLLPPHKLWVWIRDRLREYPDVALRRPILTFVFATVIAIFGVGVGAGAPYLVASWEEVLYESQLEKKIDCGRVKLTRHMGIRWARYRCEQAALFPSNFDFASDGHLLKDTLRGSDPPQSPVVLVPLISAPTLLYDPVAIACLGWLVLLARPNGFRMRSRVNHPWAVVPLMSLGLLAVKDWPQFMRNFLLNAVGRDRTIVAYPNWDVGPFSFLYQEFAAFLFTFLLAILWCQWAERLDDVRAKKRTGRPEDQVFDPKRIEELTYAYIHWQVASLLLSIPFFLTTWFYWPLILRDRDFRYIPSAITMHLLWAVSWALISLPLAFDWHHWSVMRSAAIAKLRKTSREAHQLDALKELQPVSLVNLVGTGIGAVAGFVLPFVNALRV